MNNPDINICNTQSPLKVLHAVWGLGIGGIETMLVNIANAQVDAGAEVGIMLVNNNIDESLRRALDPRISVFCANKKGLKNYPAFIRNLNRIIGDFNPAVIHLHGSRIYGYISSARYKSRCVATLHALPHGKLTSRGVMKHLTRLLPFVSTQSYGGNVARLDDMRRIFAISNAVAQLLKENYELDSTVISNGIIPSNFNRNKPGRQNDHRAFRIVQIGRLDADKKGQDLLFRALAKLGEEYTADIIGDGPSRAMLTELSQTLNISHRVNIMGARSQEYISEHLCEYDLLVQPSRVEGFGLTVAEGIAADVPVLVSRGQGPSEVTCGDKYGWTFTNGDCDDLAAKIQYISDHYSDAVDKSRRAYDHVTKEYNVATTARRYLDEYRRLVASDAAL